MFWEKSPGNRPVAPQHDFQTKGGRSSPLHSLCERKWLQAASSDVRNPPSHPGCITQAQARAFLIWGPSPLHPSYYRPVTQLSAEELSKVCEWNGQYAEAPPLSRKRTAA